VSIGFVRDNQITHGVVYDPMNNELFYAQKESGAYLNKQKIYVSSKRNIESVNSAIFMATGLSPIVHKKRFMII